MRLAGNFPFPLLTYQLYKNVQSRRSCQGDKDSGFVSLAVTLVQMEIFFERDLKLNTTHLTKAEDSVSLFQSLSPFQ